MSIKLVLLFILPFVALEVVKDQTQNNDWYAENYKCPDGWIQRCEKCYLYVKDFKSWTDAQYSCKQKGGNLVKIKDFETNMFLARYIQHKSLSAKTVWIGANDRNVEGVFEWADGSVAVPQEFRWLPDEPQDSHPGEDCVEMYARSKQYLWNDAPCSNELSFVCETSGCVNGTQRCDNGKCVSKATICDGINDCGDNSDEKNCSTTCGGLLFGTGANFTSPDYPNQYGDNRDCSWIIEVPPTYKVQLKFHAFDLEVGFDYVEVFDGSTLASKSFGRYNGNQNPNLIISTSNSIRVLLSSDSSDSMSGFFAEYTAVKETCNREITVPKDGEVYINSPKYPMNYPDDTKCVWKIKNNDPLRILTMVIYEMETEKDNDIIEVRDGYTAENYVIGRYSGNVLPNTIFSSKDKLWVKFQSNFENNKKGFKAVIRDGCYVELNVSQGLISSPGFGHTEYPNLLRCTWKINEPQGRPISIKFHQFDTERKYDAMRLLTRSGDLVAEYSGQRTKGWLDYSWLLVTNHSYIEVKFESDVTYELNGFNATFSIGCPDLGDIEGGSITGLSHYGSEVVYKCDDCYSLKNGPKQACEYGGKWNTPSPYCKEIDCGPPGLITNGGFTVALSKPNTTYILNTTVTYYCNPKYKLVGNDKIICQNDSTWSGSQPNCILKECKDPGVPLHGIINGKDFSVGSSIFFSCKEGYKMKGKSIITCNENEKWSSATPTCEPIFCPIPASPDNGILNGIPFFMMESSSANDVLALNQTTLPYNTELSITCKNGFKLNGESTTKCSYPGVFKPELGKCLDIDECMVSFPCQGVGSQCMNSLGGFYCICKNGFEKMNSTACKDINECEDSKRTVKCNQNCTNQPGGYICSCDEGYFMYDGNNKTLQKGELKNAIVNHTCFGKTCPKPPIPDHGFVINYGNRYPVVLEYVCENGYILKGEKYVKCLKTQKWDKLFPQCIVASCPEPKIVQNAGYFINGTKHDNSTEYKTQTVVLYTCNAGYERATGNLIRECTKNVTHSFWSGVLPTCKRKSCGSLNAPIHGIVNVTGTLFGDEATYNCEGGYEIVGSNKRACGNDGKWTGNAPICAASPCPDPGVPKYGIRVGTVALGKTVSYSCTKDGYTLSGSKNRTCIYIKEKGNQWTGTMPKCQDTKKPVFECPDEKNYTLPRSETKMFVNWTVPSVIDNSGEAITLSVSPNVAPPIIMKHGRHEIIYTAIDSSGNKKICKVVINVNDIEIPRIKCPKNVVITSNVPTKVIWGKGVFSDNIDILNVIFNPPNGTIFASNKYHKVVATVTDINGNYDTCVVEVYVKGCGCTLRDCPEYKPSKGISTCHINNLGLGHIISCNLECPKNYTFVDSHFHGENKKCDPKTGWPDKNIPGCEARNKLTSCMNGSVTINYNDTITGKIADVKTHTSVLFKEFVKDSTTCAVSDAVPFKYDIRDKSVVIHFKIIPHKDVQLIFIKNILPKCVADINKKIADNQKELLQLISNGLKSLSGSRVAVSLTSCCSNDKHYCCPKGNLIRTPGGTIADGSCVPCSPGTYHNVTLNRCINCPVGKFTPDSGHDECQLCPTGTRTLSAQSTNCTKLCNPGTYSSTGLQPTCRKCDYGEVQQKAGSTECLPCPAGTTTELRGSSSLSLCKASCPAGSFSQSGLEPCQLCVRGTYQDLTGRSVCKLCPSGGNYAGKEGATKEDECPTTNPCDQKLCQNEATCVPGNYSFTCTCKPGWTGKYCEVNIDECASAPCGDNGNCTDLINDYNCTCIEGIKGKNCEININDCKNDSCYNFGVCIDLINDFQCFCPAGYTGKRCEVDINECAPLPCQHNSTCIDLINDYKCNCTAGFEGKNCEKNIDECEAKPCFNNATCTDLINDVYCTCLPGYKGKFCEINIDECENQPCLNNGTCMDLINGYKCQCKPGFTGVNCEVEINECDPNPCLRNSTCLDLINKFKCECEAGYYGDRCEFEINECKSNPCQNNATCVDKINDYQCVCMMGYTGKDCDININECDPNPCVNGTCNDLIGDYSCTCQKGFTGRNCSIIIDNCESSPCVNNATCVNRIGDYKCICEPGYSGKDCEVNIDECTPDPCNGRGKNCTDLINDYICECNAMYRGKNCSVEINNCFPQPCLHNSTCTNVYEKNDFSCNCSPGYYGKRCENETNECETKPCQNNGICTDLIADYKCKCPIGFTGKNCEVNIDDCVNVTCYNGGTCKDVINDYTCMCPVTHKGAHCEKKIPDEVDIKLPGGENSYIQHSNVSSTKEFTLSLWFRYTTQPAQGTFLTLLNDKKTYPVKFLDVNQSILRLYLGSTVESIPLGKKISNKYWHHLFVSLSGTNSKVKIALDGIVLEDSVKAVIQDQTFFNPNGLIVIGKQVNKTGAYIDDGFAGEISQFGIWNRKFSERERLLVANNCTFNLTGSIIPWVGLLNGAGQNVSLIELWSCGKNICPAEYTGKFCETKIDKIPPTVVSCPLSKKIITGNATTRVYWDEPTFADNVAVVKILRSHAPGQIFTWGDYIVTYIAKDAFDNVATCTFELFVTPFNCSELTASPNSVDTCGTWKWGRFCDFKCLATYELAVPKPPFYSCGRMGTWSHGPPVYPENPNNVLPTCTATKQADNTGSNSFIYQTSKCDEAFTTNFTEQFKSKILSIHESWKICGDICNFDNLRVRCNAKKRKRRDTATQYKLEISFDTQFDTVNNSAKEDLQQGVKNGKVDLTINVDGNNVPVEKGETLVGETVLTCSNGSVLKGDKCVLCPPGSYKDSAITVCASCPVGAYSASGSSRCIQCPPGKTTFGDSATSIKSCIDKCEAGFYMDKKNMVCKKCEIGFYKDKKGYEACTSCPMGKTTEKTGSTNKNHCSLYCSLGEEMINSKCTPCLRGYYRDSFNQSECIACPYGKTTYEEGSKNMQCLAHCLSGFEVSWDGSECMPCDIGFYKSSNMSKQCSKCPNGQVTKSYGSDSQSACFEPSSITLYDATLSFTSMTWNANMMTKSSAEFRNTAYQITEALLSVYSGNKKLKSITINDLKSGSVVALMTFSFDTNYVDPFEPLRVEINKGEVNGKAVNASSFSTDRCTQFTCPVDQICWYNTTGAGCMCKNGFFMSNDGKRCYVKCELDYCLNDGVCQETQKGRSCTCKDSYKGNRCEDKEKSEKHIALLIGLIMGCIVVALIIGCCLKITKNKRSGKFKTDQNPLTDAIHIESVKNTPITVHIDKSMEAKPIATTAFVNKAVDLNDEEC